MSEDQYTDPGREQQALLEYLMQQINPEWSVSKQAYQPFDIANETSGLNIMQDRFQLMENPLMGIINGTFDYSLLDDVYDEGGDAPDSQYTGLYGSNPKYQSMIAMLQGGDSAEDAAMAAWAQHTAAQEGIDISELDSERAAADPSFKSFQDVAKQIQPEAAAQFQYQSTGGGGKMRKSDMAQQLEAMGISSAQTEDNYFSDSIDQKRIDEARTIESTDRIIKEFEDKKRKFGEGSTNPYLNGLGEAAGETKTTWQKPLPPPSKLSQMEPGSAEAAIERGSRGPSLADMISSVANMWQDQAANDLGQSDGPSKQVGSKNGPKTDPATRGRYYGGGDPRDPRSQTGKAMKWDADKEKNGGRSSTGDLMKYINAKQGRVHGNSSAIERALVQRERDSGRTAQQDALTKLLLGQPRG